MKKETEKKLLELREKLIYNGGEPLWVKMIDEALVCESTDVKLGKLDLFDLCEKDDLRPAFMGIAHLNGYRYATDTYILLKLKSDYPNEFEGRVLLKDGSLLPEQNLPKYDSVIPPITKEHSAITLNFDKLAEILKRAKVHKKAYKKVHSAVVEFNNTWVDLYLFEKFAKVMKEYNITEFYFKNPSAPIVINTDKVAVILMPMQKREKVEDNIFVAEI